MKGEKGFEIGELGREVLNEWYAEREPVAVGLEGGEAERVPSSQLSVEAESDKKSEQEVKREAIKGEIKKFLNLGAERGLPYAIKEVKRRDDPFLLDVFHDVLARDGNYRKILKE